MEYIHNKKSEFLVVILYTTWSAAHQYLTCDHFITQPNINSPSVPMKLSNGPDISSLVMVDGGQNDQIIADTNHDA